MISKYMDIFENICILKTLWFSWRRKYRDHEGMQLPQYRALALHFGRLN